MPFILGFLCALFVFSLLLIAFGCWLLSASTNARLRQRIKELEEEDHYYSPEVKVITKENEHDS
jgi:hypothetical protein